jgi:tetratricopeptide (TPR) repeat protein
MSMSNQDLARFERRLADWEITHSMQFERGIDRIVDANLKHTYRVIVSQERIESGIDKVALGIDKVANRLRNLESAFMWYHLDIVWRLELQRETLRRILEVLQAPLDTQAKELRKTAEDAYRNGWIDEALEDFLESEKKNRYDFTIHQSLGNIYLFHKRNPVKALEYYKKAAKYAAPKSRYYTCLALIHSGLIGYLLEDFQYAYKGTSLAIKISPKFYEAHYKHAQYCALLGKQDEAIEHLETAIKGDIYYCVKADNEKDFEVMKERLQSFFKELRDNAQSIAE